MILECRVGFTSQPSRTYHISRIINPNWNTSMSHNNNDVIIEVGVKKGTTKWHKISYLGYILWGGEKYMSSDWFHRGTEDRRRITWMISRSEPAFSDWTTISKVIIHALLCEAGREGEGGERMVLNDFQAAQNINHTNIFIIYNLFCTFWFRKYARSDFKVGPFSYVPSSKVLVPVHNKLYFVFIHAL